MPGKLRSRWTGPYTITKIWPYGAVELRNEVTKQEFKVNGQRIKAYLGGPVDEPEEFDLNSPELSELEGNGANVLALVESDQRNSEELSLGETTSKNLVVAHAHAHDDAQQDAQETSNLVGRSQKAQEPINRLNEPINTHLRSDSSQNPNPNSQITYFLTKQRMTAINETLALEKVQMSTEEMNSVVAHGHDASPEAQQGNSELLDHGIDSIINSEVSGDREDESWSFDDVIAVLEDAQEDEEISDAESATGENNPIQFAINPNTQNVSCALVPTLPHAQQAVNKGKEPFFGPIKKRRAAVRRDWPLAKPKEAVAHDGDAQEEEPYAPEDSFDSEDVSEPSGTEEDYNAPEMAYEFKHRSLNEDLDDSDGETRLSQSITGTSDNEWLTNSSREGADDPSIDVEGLSQGAKWDAYQAAEERMELEQKEREDIARVAAIHLEQRMGIEVQEDEPREVDELDDVVILSLPDRSVDPGAFTIPAVIDGTLFLKCLVDSGAARNIISETAYRRLTLTPLIPYHGHLRFGNQAPVRPLGILEVNILVEGYPVPVELVVVKTDRDGRDSRWKVVLGRPFMATVRAEQSFYSHELTLHLPNVLLRFSPEGDLKKREPHNEAIRWEQEIPRVRTHVQPSMGGWRGRGRGRR